MVNGLTRGRVLLMGAGFVLSLAAHAARCAAIRFPRSDPVDQGHTIIRVR